MGMFDYVKCHYPLPVKGAEDLIYQTKDTPSQWLDMYEIRADGTLWHEDRSAQKKRPGPVKWTGEIVFYADKLEFSAYFVAGKLLHLERLDSNE
ncbi:MAG: hypothetical protein K1X48_09600 [Burkholderiaceae bacterium]|nr:hypothetical protein [Burkholderiaceae bacterium]